MNPLKAEIVHLTHNDLDAIGCMLNLELATPGIKKTTFHTNYQNLNEKTHEVLAYINQNPVKLLVISDIAFASNKSDLLELQSVVQDGLGIKILYFDHHVYGAGFFDDITFKYIHDIKDSATGIMFKYFNKDDTLKELSKYINDYDTWVETSPTFKISLGVNDWLWNESKNKSMDQIVYEIVQNNYKLPKMFIDYFKNYTTNYTNKLQSLKERGLFVNDGFLAMVFTDEYFNEALYESFHLNGNKMALIINSYGIIRMRFSTIDCLTIPEKEKIKIAIMGKLDHGHLNAFSIKVENSNFEKIMGKVQELTTIINTNKP